MSKSVKNLVESELFEDKSKEQEASRVNSDMYWFNSLFGGVQIIEHWDQNGKDYLQLACTQNGSDGGSFIRQRKTGFFAPKYGAAEKVAFERDLSIFLKDAMDEFDANVEDFLKEKGFILEKN